MRGLGYAVEPVAERGTHGTPEPMARLLLQFFQAAREGRFARVDPLLAGILGREPRTVRDLLAIDQRPGPGRAPDRVVLSLASAHRQ